MNEPIKDLEVKMCEFCYRKGEDRVVVYECGCAEERHCCYFHDLATGPCDRCRTSPMFKDETYFPTEEETEPDR